MENVVRKFNIKNFFVGTLNVVICCVIVVVFFNIIIYQQKKYQNKHIDNFKNTIQTMEQLAVNYLQISQEICNSWALYINNSNYTMEQAMDYLSVVNTNPQNRVHLIWQDSLEGLSTTIYDINSEFYGKKNVKVNYSFFDDIFKDFLQRISIRYNTNTFKITRTFIDPITNSPVVAFCNRVKLRTNDNNTKIAILLRVVPLNEIRKLWVFPSEYEKAEFFLINNAGEYIISSESLSGVTFFDFIRQNNTLSYYKEKEIVRNIYKNETGTFFYKDANAMESCFTYSHIDSNPGWILFGYSTLENLQIAVIDWSVGFFIVIAISLLLVVDWIYFINANNSIKNFAKIALDASKEKTNFLSTMSHDIRTPMNAIIGMTHIACQEIDNKNKVADCLKKIDLASNHLLTLVNDVLDISKIESGRIILCPYDFSIFDMIENHKNIILPMAEEKKIHLSFKVQNIIYEYLYADLLRLNQIFLNILSNAIKYTNSEGRVEVNIKQVELSDEKVLLNYVVRDTGIGMSKEFLDNLYSPFSREKDSRIHSIAGTGLGLTITKKLVDVLNGKIDCISSKGIGTVFSITLELQISKENSLKQNENDIKELNNQFDVSSLIILVAEDNDLNWEIIENMIGAFGAKCERAINGKECVEKIISAKVGDFDLIFMDIQMPEMNGLEATKKIRSLENNYYKNIPIIAMTADAFSENITECLSVGMNAHVSKPIDIKKVLYEIQKIFQF